MALTSGTRLGAYESSSVSAAQSAVVPEIPYAAVHSDCGSLD